VGRHLLHLLLFSGLVSTFFGLLSGRNRRGRIRIGLYLMAGMVGISLALAWVMYAFTR
jgi:hypothetical protein